MPVSCPSADNRSGKPRTASASTGGSPRRRPSASWSAAAPARSRRSCAHGAIGGLPAHRLAPIRHRPWSSAPRPRLTRSAPWSCAWPASGPRRTGSARRRRRRPSRRPMLSPHNWSHASCTGRGPRGARGGTSPSGSGMGERRAPQRCARQPEAGTGQDARSPALGTCHAPPRRPSAAVMRDRANLAEGGAAFRKRPWTPDTPYSQPATLKKPLHPRLCRASPLASNCLLSHHGADPCGPQQLPQPSLSTKS